MFWTANCPDGSGLELCQKLGEITPGVPCIFYSGDAYDIHRSEAFAAGADAYVAKPDIERLIESVRELLSEENAPPLLLLPETKADLEPIHRLRRFRRLLQAAADSFQLFESNFGLICVISGSSCLRCLWCAVDTPIRQRIISSPLTGR